MQTVVKKLTAKRGISSTLYDPRKTQALSVERLSKMDSELRDITTRIGFSNCTNCIPPVTNTIHKNAKYNAWAICSRLSLIISS